MDRALSVATADGHRLSSLGLGVREFAGRVLSLSLPLLDHTLYICICNKYKTFEMKYYLQLFSGKTTGYRVSQKSRPYGSHRQTQQDDCHRHSKVTGITLLCLGHSKVTGSTFAEAGL